MRQFCLILATALGCSFTFSNEKEVLNIRILNANQTYLQNERPPCLHINLTNFCIICRVLSWQFNIFVLWHTMSFRQKAINVFTYSFLFALILLGWLVPGGNELKFNTRFEQKKNYKKLFQNAPSPHFGFGYTFWKVDGY